MKKRDRAKKKAEMPEISFKEFTAEEGAIYEEAIGKFREAVSADKTLRQAYESYSIADAELRSLIQADFLKILIAERHFAQRQPLEKVARDPRAFRFMIDGIRDHGVSLDRGSI